MPAPKQTSTPSAVLCRQMKKPTRPHHQPCYQDGASYGSIWSRARVFFGAEDNSVPQEVPPLQNGHHLIFPRKLTDQLRRLQSLSLAAMYDLGWSVMAHCLGPSLRSLHLRMPLPGETHLDKLAKSSPHLENFTLISTSGARVTDASLSSFLRVCGGTLKRLVVSDLTPTESGSTASTARLPALASLATHCRQLEELHLGEGVSLSTQDLESLSGPSCPPLRTLSLQSAEPVSHLGQKTSPERKKRLMSALVKCYEAVAGDVIVREHRLGK